MRLLTHSYALLLIDVIRASARGQACLYVKPVRTRQSVGADDESQLDLTASSLRAPECAANRATRHCDRHGVFE